MRKYAVVTSKATVKTSAAIVATEITDLVFSGEPRKGVSFVPPNVRGKVDPTAECVSPTQDDDNFGLRGACTRSCWGSP